MTQDGPEHDLGDLSATERGLVALVDRAAQVLTVGEVADRLVAALRANGSEVTAVALSEPLPTEAVDAVVLPDALTRAPDPVALLSQARGALRPGGRVVLSVPNATHGSHRLRALVGRPPLGTAALAGAGFRAGSREGLEQLASQADCVVEVLQGTVADPVEGVEPDVAHRLPPGVVEWVRGQPDAFLHHLLAVVRPAAEGRPAARVELLDEPELVRRRDRHTEAHEADLRERREVLTVRDHIIGLEAAATAAQREVARAQNHARRLEKRNQRKTERLAELQGVIRKLRRQVADVEEAATPPGPRGLTRRAPKR